MELLTSKAKGLKKYGDRNDRFLDILNELQSSGKHLIFIGQIDMEPIHTPDFQSNKLIIKVNSIVNEKYRCYIEKGKFLYETLKQREPAIQTPVKDLHEKQKQVNETVVKEDGSTYEEVDMTNQPTRKQQTNLNEMVVEDPEPLRSLMNQFIRELETEGKEINKSNIRVKASQYKRETEMPPLNFKDLIEFINENCPEELD